MTGIWKCQQIMIAMALDLKRRAILVLSGALGSHSDEQIC
jgi:hypothetical protein